MYTATGSLATWTAAGDIVEINAPADGIVVIHSVQVTQSTSETDDSTEIRISRFSVSGTGGATPTANPMEVGTAAFGGTIEEGSTADASGTEAELYSEGISLLAGFQKIWTPDMRPIIPPSGRIVVKTITAVASVTINYVVEFEEIG